MAKLLLVEPNIQLAKTYSLALGSAGHQVRLAANAQEAVKLLDNGGADLIILELQLPVHNGVEFLYEIRSYSDWLDIPVVIHSQVSPAEPGISGMLWQQLNVRKYLYKPHTKLARLTDEIDNQLLPA